MIHIGDTSIDLKTGRVERRGDVLILEPRILNLLRFLAANPGRVVGRDELLEAVWGHVEAGSDDSVNTAVSKLRQILGDSGRPHRIIQTVPRRGYQWMLEHETEETSGHGSTVPEQTQPGGPAVAVTPGGRRWSILAASLLAIFVLLGVIWLVLGVWQPDTPSVAGDGEQRDALTSSQAEPVLAVLPFMDLSESGDQEAFADGLADMVLHQLAQVKALKVIARTSSFVFKDSDANVAEIADLLGANVVLEGSVQRVGDRLRVIVQLIDARDQSHLWSGTYDRSAREVFDVQDDIASHVAVALTQQLVPESSGTGSLGLEAFELISQGRLEMDKGTLVGAESAVALFQRVVELAPNYAIGYIYLLDALGMRDRLSDWSLANERDEYRSLVDRAHALEPENPEVHRKLGELMFYERDYVGAEAAYRRALELNPNGAQARSSYGYMLFRLDRVDEALHQFRLALLLDPLSKVSHMMLARTYWAMGRAEEAVVKLRENIHRHPDYPDNYNWMATFLLQLGRTGEAMRFIEAAYRMDPGSPHAWFRMCEFYLQLGDVDAAEACTDELTEAIDIPGRELYLRALVHSGRGEWAQRRELIQQLYEQDFMLTLIPDLAALAWSRTDCGQALAVLKRSYPTLFEHPPQIARVQTLGALVAGYCLGELGQLEESEEVLTAIEANLERTRMMRAPHAVSGIESVQILALRGKTDQALDEFEKLVGNDWRYYWWRLDEHPLMQSLRGHPRFESLLEQLESGVAEQRRWYYDNRDEPLLP